MGIQLNTLEFNGACPWAEEHQAVAAVPGGEVAEGDVREGADEVEVADDGEPRRRRDPAQRLQLPARPQQARRVDEQHEEREEEEEEGEARRGAVPLQPHLSRRVIAH